MADLSPEKNYWHRVHQKVNDYLPEVMTYVALRTKVEALIGPRPNTDAILLVPLTNDEVDFDTLKWTLASKVNEARGSHRKLSYAYVTRNGAPVTSTAPTQSAEETYEAPALPPPPAMPVSIPGYTRIIPRVGPTPVEAPAPMGPSSSFEETARAAVSVMSRYMHPDLLRIEQMAKDLPDLLLERLPALMENLIEIEKSVGLDLVEQKVMAAPTDHIRPTAPRLAARRAAYDAALALFSELEAMRDRWDVPETEAPAKAPRPKVVVTKAPSLPAEPPKAKTVPPPAPAAAETPAPAETPAVTVIDEPSEEIVTGYMGPETSADTYVVETLPSAAPEIVKPLTKVAAECPRLHEALSSGLRILIIGGENKGGYALNRKAFLQNTGIDEASIDTWFMDGSRSRVFGRDRSKYVGFFILDKWINHAIADSARAVARATPKLPFVYVGDGTASKLYRGMVDLETQLRAEALFNQP